ncbi:GT2 family glycosyltransferase/glycosyltransferase involved in cell wall biosynthesis [Erwinia toletana]|uniref:GT2 family glycosyltransferase/glycosyltransferase involved in cell wall biosynthesis n=1 Tax=Winslowiella toletana TaxID=92490 RepID=A0ABS4P3A5_9GAMM|nr:glycosyltransferase [Winslowiella toletana]MBP2167131.1 GT2 family glycosyltransferase/glycosyltransferase involved in cell wall biosynthesis [Winslowiella toletana]
MKRILLTIDKINRFTDCETTFLDIVEHFHHKGWQVDIVTRIVDGHFLKQLREFKDQGQVNYYTEDQHSLAQSYQLIWICQGYMSAAMISALQAGELSGVCVFHHYFNYADQDLPYGASLENKLAWRSLAVSNVSATKMALKGIDQRKLKIFPLLVSEAFCQPLTMPAPQALTRILLLSADKSEEVTTLTSLLAEQGIVLDCLNTGRGEVEVTPEYLQDYQAVMGESRLIAQGLALGLPAYVTDTFYGGGYVSQHNLETHLDRHFLADVDMQIASTEAWAADIVDHFATAQLWARGWRQEAIARWGLNPHLEQIVQELPEAKPLSISQSEAASLTLHRKVVAEDAEKSRVLENWLKTRQPSVTRIEVLRSFLQQSPAAADIGVVIVQQPGEEDAVKASLASLQTQQLAAQQVLLAEASDLSALFATSERTSLLVINAGTVLQPQALLLFAEHCLRQPEVAVWYCDTINGTHLQNAEMLLKPDINLDLLRSQPYIGNQLLVNLAAVREFGELEASLPQLALLDLVWKIIETRGTAHIGHISDVLMQIPTTYDSWLMLPGVIAENLKLTTAHLARCGLPADVGPGLAAGLQRVRFHHQERPLVSIIIPTRDRLPLLRRCIESLMEKTRWQQYELLIVDNGSQDADACEYLGQLEALDLAQVRVLRWPHPFNFSAINNFAVEQARGELLLLLNNDIEIIDGDWLEALVEHALRPEVGIVGARLEFHDGRIQHAGIATGVGLGAGPVYEGTPGDNPGYMQRLNSIHNVTAVSAACMMVRKSVYQELAGLDDVQFPVYLSDVDFALKARDAGYLTVWTPYARLQHMGGATRVLGDKIGVPSFPAGEIFDVLREKWRNALSSDISYNRQLAKVGSNFRLGTRQAEYQQPLPGRPLPVMMACNKNFTGCGNYRVIMPFKALEHNLVLEGGLTHGFPSVMEVAEVQPDILLLELIVEPEVSQRIKQYRQVSNTKIIMEYDDYLPNLPLKSAFRKQVPKDVVSRLRRSIEQADWLVVSTEPLAESYAPFHHDIRVAKNRLDVELWGSLTSARRQGKKPRVGWAGGSSHTGDLEILLPFIKELENDVDWVFMGMKPQGIKCEYHIGVPFDYYPEKLSTLNLDLALVPLEINQFNECKSNLRLLELGALGVPVICTDIEPYRCNLPVTCVSNRYKDWMKAIREHLSDMDALARNGDVLRDAVHKDWMLRDHGIDDWAQAWLPR